MGVAEDAIGPSDLVEQGLGTLLKENLAGILLMFQNLRNYLVEPSNDFLLASPRVVWLET